MTDDVGNRPLRTSSSIAALAAALAKAQSAFVPLKKDKTARIETRSGGTFSYSYVDLATIQEAIRGPLSANELAYTQAVSVRHQHVCVETTLLHSSGEWLSAELEFGIADAADARAIGSSITYGRRFGLSSLVGIAASDEDDDAAGTVGPATRRDQARPRTRATSPATPVPDIELPARSVAVNPKRRPDQEPLSDPQRRKMFGEAKRCGWQVDGLKAVIREKFGIESTGDLRSGDLDTVLEIIRRGPPPTPTPPTRVPGEDDIPF